MTTRRTIKRRVTLAEAIEVWRRLDVTESGYIVTLVGSTLDLGEGNDIDLWAVPFPPREQNYPGLRQMIVERVGPLQAELLNAEGGFVNLIAETQTGASVDVLVFARRGETLMVDHPRRLGPDVFTYRDRDPR